MSLSTHKRRQINIHACDLTQSSDSNLPKLAPNAHICARLKRRYQKWILVSDTHPLTRFALRSKAAINFERRRHGRCLHWWIIHPFSNLRYTWDMMMILTYIYLFVMFPHVFAFQRVSKNTGVESFTYLYPAYAICIVDIVLNMITGFRSSDGHEIFLDPFLVAQRYLKSYFIVDLLSSIPYTWFYKDKILPPGPGSNSILLLLEVLPFLKFIRLGTLRTYIKKFNLSYGASHGKDMFVWLIILAILIFHWSACFSFGFPFVALHLTGETLENCDARVIKLEFYKEQEWWIYTKCLHKGLSNLIGAIYLDLYSAGTLDKISHCTLLLFGQSFLVYAIVIILQWLESSSEPELKYQELIQGVKDYARKKKFSKNLQDKLISYYAYRFQGSYFKEQTIAHTLSKHLNKEIQIYSSRELLETAQIFHDLSRPFIADLIGSLKSVLYLENDIIYTCNDEGDCMYFIQSGTVALITFAGIEIYHLHDGDHFGMEVLLEPGNRRNETVISLEVCELLRFSRRDFKRIVSRDSEFFKRLTNDAKRRAARIEELNNQGFTEVNLQNESKKSENNDKNEQQTK